ncbi:hypothetical protein GQ607_010401 [Colletotrichum asianum]|uniref:Uncharacterized protein n=1 Tax=Colletotrichum asianum TaxID=702518 RepID=A0A8H3W9L2_9PEZI|nr:hypothetical protein GQ607_010401 [Colletotrichum asianum]
MTCSSTEHLLSSPDPNHQTNSTNTITKRRAVLHCAVLTTQQVSVRGLPTKNPLHEPKLPTSQLHQISPRNSYLIASTLRKETHHFHI